MRTDWLDDGFEWRTKRAKHLTASGDGSLRPLATTNATNRERTTRQDIHSNMRHLGGDHMRHATTWCCGGRTLGQTYCIFFASDKERKRNLWSERNSATKGRGGKLNSAKCTCEKRVRPMYMHIKCLCTFAREGAKEKKIEKSVHISCIITY